MVGRPTQTYVVAVKRDQRDAAPSDWVALIRAIPGVSVRGSASPIRVQIDATAEAAHEIQQQFGGFCHIETAIIHKPS